MIRLSSEDARVILKKMAEGNSIKAIASDMAMPEGTMRSALHRLYKKLGANNAPHAVALAIARKIIQTKVAS